MVLTYVGWSYNFPLKNGLFFKNCNGIIKYKNIKTINAWQNEIN